MIAWGACWLSILCVMQETGTEYKTKWRMKSGFLGFQQMKISIDDEELIGSADSTELPEVQIDTETYERLSSIYFSNITLLNLSEVLLRLADFI